LPVTVTVPRPSAQVAPGRDDEVAVNRPAGNHSSAGCVSGTGGRHGAGQNPEGRERHYGEEGQKSPRRCGAAAVAIVAIHVTFLRTYSGIISQAAGFCLIVLPSRSPDKAKPVLYPSARVPGISAVSSGPAQSTMAAILAEGAKMAGGLPVAGGGARGEAARPFRAESRPYSLRLTPAYGPEAVIA
jgi:hypothetical protein